MSDLVVVGSFMIQDGQVQVFGEEQSLTIDPVVRMAPSQAGR